VQTIVSGCLGVAGRPTLRANAAPRLGAGGFAFALDGVRPLTLAALLVGDRLGRTDLLGCDVAPTGGTASLLATTTLAGGAAFALPIPNVQALLGLALTSQGFALDGAAPAGFAGSNALFVVIGG
jgi:hypothetical protein